MSVTISVHLLAKIGKRRDARGRKERRKGGRKGETGDGRRMHLQSCVKKHACQVLRIALKMFRCPLHNCTRAQYSCQPFPKPGRNVFTQRCTAMTWHFADKSNIEWLGERTNNIVMRGIEFLWKCVHHTDPEKIIQNPFRHSRTKMTLFALLKVGGGMYLNFRSKIQYFPAVSDINRLLL